MGMEEIRMRRVKQVLDRSRIENIPAEITKEFDRIRLKEKIKPGMQIGIPVGSRGIANLQLIIKSIIAEVRKHGGVPFIIPSMGSHGGATAEGQRKVLFRYGVTEETMGVPIRSSMEVVELGRLSNGLPVYFDRIALESDGLIVANRIKPHTAFKSDIESGLHKMLSVGLGNHQGATLVHYLGEKGLREDMVEFARIILKKAPVLCGLGILENAYDDTYRLVAATPGEFERVEKELLKECKRMMFKLPAEGIDILLVEEMGKDISGTGMDTNIVGGIRGFLPADYTSPRIRKIIVLDLTKETGGNALGVGLADLITRKVFDKIDFKDTYANTITTTFLDRAKIPIFCDTEKEAFDIALKTSWIMPGKKPRVMIIRNTLHLDELYVSEPIWEEIKGQSTIQPGGDWEPLAFDAQGNLTLHV